MDDMGGLEVVLRKMGHEPRAFLQQRITRWGVQEQDALRCMDCGYVRGRMSSPDEEQIAPCMVLPDYAQEMVA